MGRGLAALVSLVAAATVLSAQQPPQSPPAQPPQQQQPPAQQPPVFRGGTNQVRVDVTVTDRKGDPIRDLTRDDFEVREDGVPQAIDTIKLIEASGAAPNDDM